MKRWKLGVAALAAVAVPLAALTAPATGREEAATQTRNCSFALRIGNVLPFTGDLAAFGGNLDRAARLAVDLQNQALKRLKLSQKISVRIVDSEDGQTAASASVEAATKLVKTDRVSVVIGEMASSATIPMAQSVTIPNKVVTISPTSSAPQISDIKDNGYLWRVYPSDALQGRVLGQAAVDAFGRGSTINVGARNDAFGTALRQLFEAQWKKLGGKIGESVSWNPAQATFDTEAAKLVEGNPKGFVIIDFPDTFQKFAPSLVRTGKWSASKTLMTEAVKNTEVLAKIGSPAQGLRGTAASSVGGPAGKPFEALYKAKVKGAKPYTTFEGTAFDAANVAFLGALAGCSSKGSSIKTHLRAVSGPGGPKVTYRNLDKAIKLLLARKDVDYEGAFSPVDFDAKGDIGSAVFEIWKYEGGKISTLKTITFRG